MNAPSRIPPPRGSSWDSALRYAKWILYSVHSRYPFVMLHMPLAARPLGLKASFSFPGRILLLGLFLDLPLPFIGTSKASSVALGTLEAFSNHGQKLFGQKLGMSKIGFGPARSFVF